MTGVVSWYNSRFEQKVIVLTLGRQYQIKSFGHGKKFGNWVELGVDSCNPNEMLL
jgi:hypothetical protein